MILVVNPNSALDRVAVVHYEERSTLRPLRYTSWAGGSGVHAGFVARLLGAEVKILGFVGGHIGALFRAQLAQQGLTADLVEIDGETRQTFSLLDADRGNLCDIAEGGPVVTPRAVQQLIERTVTHLPKAELLIISGSVPPGCPADLPTQVITAANSAGVPVIADLAGDVLLAAIHSKPWLIKPSRSEIAAILGTDTVTLEDVIPLAQQWIADGVEHVCISLDTDGLLWISQNQISMVLPPVVPAFNSIGCGDALVGATAASYVQTQNLELALRTGIAAATANLAYDAPGYCESTDIDRLLPNVTIQEFTRLRPIQSRRSHDFSHNISKNGEIQ